MSRRILQFALSQKGQEMHGAALGHAQDGRPVFPCHPESKHPLVKDWPHEATTDPAKIGQWWRQFPGAMIGVPMGAASGLWCIDLDRDPAKGLDGVRAFAELLKTTDAKLPPTMSSETPRGGIHLFFAWPDHVEIRNSASKIARGIDVRGTGGFVILPPSVRADGKAYAWRPHSAVEAAPAPQWLIERAMAPAEGSVEAPGNGHSAGFWRALGEGAGEGTRNDSVARLAGHLLRRRVDPFLVLDLVQAWNAVRVSPPLSPSEITKTINSICKREERRRNG